MHTHALATIGAPLSDPVVLHTSGLVLSLHSRDYAL